MRRAVLALATLAACGSDRAPTMPAETPAAAVATAIRPETRTVAAASWSEHLKRGRDLARQRDWRSAVAELEAGFAARPDSGALVSELGWALLQTGELERAAAVMKPYADTGPAGRERAAIHYNLGRVAEVRADTAAAVRHYRASLADRASAVVQRRLDAVTAAAPGAPEIVADDGHPGVLELAGFPAISARGDVIALGELDEPGDTCEASADLTLMRVSDMAVIETVSASVRNSSADDMDWCKPERKVSRDAAAFTRRGNRLLTDGQFRTLTELGWAEDGRVGAGLRVRFDDTTRYVTISRDGTTGAAPLWQAVLPVMTGHCGGDTDERPSRLQAVHVDPASDLVLVSYGWGYDQCGCGPGPSGHRALHLPR